MSLVTIAAAPAQNANNNSIVADARLAHAASTGAGGTVLSFSCLNEIFAPGE